ncbi:porin [uncultured Parasutterella sp.]|uniref:porin n=1 Tax=uncultured Parasutterella sp. TaxID=1263098 RepID=UPI00351C0FA7
MKKTLLAMGVLGAFSSLAFAASNVTLYGLIEEGVVVSKAKHKDTMVDLKAGFDSGNRWGIKGVEELGNGYSVGFILEQGFNADDGSEGVAGKAFNVNLSFMLTADLVLSPSVVLVV